LPGARNTTTNRKNKMKKITALAVALLSIIPVSAHASTPKTLAIIDTGVDMTNNSIKNNIIYEVCVSGYNSCPNKNNFQEGAGASTISPAMLTNNAWVHGTEVASAAIQTDPNVKIIEIRCASFIAPTGYIGCNNDMLTTALNWISSNQIKFNIGAVVAPFGSLSSKCNTSAPYVSSINQLTSAGLAVIFPTGNDFNYTSVDNPACLQGVLAISSIDDKGRLALYANYSPRVDFAALGNLTVATVNNQTKTDSGTSFSVAVFGAGWLKIQNLKGLSYQSEYNLIKSTSLNYTNIMVKSNVAGINLAAALK